MSEFGSVYRCKRVIVAVIVATCVTGLSSKSLGGDADPDSLDPVTVGMASNPCYAIRVANYAAMTNAKDLQCDVRSGGRVVEDNEDAPGIRLCDGTGEYIFRTVGWTRWGIVCHAIGGVPPSYASRAVLANHLQCGVISGGLTLEGIQFDTPRMWGLIVAPDLCTDDQALRSTEEVFCPPGLEIPRGGHAVGADPIIAECARRLLEAGQAYFHKPGLRFCKPITDWPKYDQEILEALRLGTYASAPPFTRADAEKICHE